MGALIEHAERMFTRRVALRQPNIRSPAARRQRSSAIEKPKAQVSREETKSESQPTTVSPLPLWQRLGPLSKGFNTYIRTQKKRPYATQVGSSLVIYLCGDLSAQTIGGEEYNAWRTLRNMTIGCISSIPAYRWFMYLGQSFNYSSKALSLGAKVVVNQIVFAPMFNTYFFGMSSLLSGDSLNQAWERVKDTVPISLINSFKLWPAVTAFNFTFIQPQYRALFAGFIAIGWQSYLSWLNQRAANDERARTTLPFSTDEVASGNPSNMIRAEA